ncbi:MAG: 30S ribosome-binding factor RbfA [Clostridia bacterium]|nr:30S ribosome-binding factor RbfA [Clostridia bacterium]
MTNKRMSRVDAEIQKSLAEIISKFDDVNITGTLVSIMKVDTTADFSLAKVYVSVLGDKSKKSLVVKKLNENQKTIRYELAHKLKLRTVPEMTFIVDEVEERASRVLKLFEQIEGESNDVREDN